MSRLTAECWWENGFVMFSVHSEGLQNTAVMLCCPIAALWQGQSKNLSPFAKYNVLLIYHKWPHKHGQTFRPLKAHTQSLLISALQPCSSPFPGWCVSGATAKLCNSTGSTDKLRFLSCHRRKAWGRKIMSELTRTYAQLLSAGCSVMPPLFLGQMCPLQVVKTTFSGFAAKRFDLNPSTGFESNQAAGTDHVVR